ncbi:hypothetical protein [Yinghuangia sp. YIM S09857]|uniref:hypothetical protein n=1 Tax=Yinghuangia sp. YIM S09857 TaxID=3436929 RepID=UPI003F529188
MGWTVAQAAAAAGIVELTAIDDGWTWPIIAGLVALKAAAARKIGDSDSAATLPKKKADLGQALRGRP